MSCLRIHCLVQFDALFYRVNGSAMWRQFFAFLELERKLKQLTYKYLFLVQIHLFWNSYGIEKCWTKSSIIFAWSRKRLFFRAKTHHFGVFCSFLGSHTVHYQFWTIWNNHFGMVSSLLCNHFVHYEVWMIWSYEMDQIFHIWKPKMFFG